MPSTRPSLRRPRTKVDVSFAELPAMDRRRRLRGLRDTFAAPGPLVDCDALIVSDLSSIRYLSGFTGSAGTLWVDAGRACLLTDGRYDTQSRDELERAGLADVVEVFVGNPPDQDAQLTELATRSTSVAAEAQHLSWSRAEQLREKLGSLVPTDGAVASLRGTKDDGEVARIEAAAAIADAALAATVGALRDGCTEAEFARQLDHEMLCGGAQARSFETICASGPNAALPHGRPTDRRVERGDLVIVDFGAVIDGYHSDMTRTFYVGPGEPTGAAREMLEAVAAAQQLGVDAVTDGVERVKVDDACRSHLLAAGLGDEFTHGTGHGVGLDIHEEPWIGPKARGVLSSGNVVTVEPGVYRRGFGGVRVEDTVLVTATGARLLTRAPKHPTI